MNKVIYNYIIKNYLKIVLNMTLVFFGVVILLNLFQEIEFFKEIDVGIQMPITLTIMLAPNIVIKIFPFIIFFSAMWYLVSINNTKELLTLKVFGISNLKMISILSIVTFLIGIIILMTINPFTSSMIKYYEQTKSAYSKDTDHLVSINKNGVWIKEKTDEKLKLMYAKNLENNYLNKLSIYVFNTSNKDLERIEVDKADITSNNWVLSNVKVYNNDNNLPETKELMTFNSMFNLSKIKSAYKNLDTISFVRLLKEQERLLNDTGSGEDLTAERRTYLKNSVIQQDINRELQTSYDKFVFKNVDQRSAVEYSEKWTADYNFELENSTPNILKLTEVNQLDDIGGKTSADIGSLPNNVSSIIISFLKLLI